MYMIHYLFKDGTTSHGAAYYDREFAVILQQRMEYESGLVCWIKEH